MKISLDVINRRLEHTISMMNLTHNHTNYPKCQKGGKKHIGKRLQEREEQDGKKKKIAKFSRYAKKHITTGLTSTTKAEQDENPKETMPQRILFKFLKSTDKIKTLTTGK
jgi:hypothetical protein